MYQIVLAIHNILRWVVLILAVVALYRAYAGWIGKRDYTETDRKSGVFFSISIDIQLLVGIILYIFLSPITRTAFQDFGTAMTIPDIRFFAVEHILLMILAVILVHVGTVVSKRATSDESKHRRAAIWYSLTVLAIILAIPWWRPLLPGIGL
jgi:Na+-driven multidrug efflux pump